jgi:hypothetical protein
MAEELIGELLVGIAEVVADAASTSKNEKHGCGCIITTVIMLVITIIGLYYLTRK